jgi:hypothetical protein
MVDYTFDFRGAIKWISLLKFTQFFRGMNPNQTIEVQGLDMDTRADLLKVLPEISYELIDVEEDVDTSYKMQLRKRGIRTGKADN